MVSKLEIDVKNKFLVGNRLELMTPMGNVSFVLNAMENLKGETITDAKGSGHKVAISIATDFDLTLAIMMRNLNESETIRQPFSQDQADK